MTAQFNLANRRSLGVGIIGTGFAAKLRTEVFQADARAHVVAVAGNDPDKSQAFAQTHAIPTVCSSWKALIQQPEVDLVVVCSINSEHLPATRAALGAGKAVVVEYPLALSALDAAEAIALAQQQQLFLHIEHIELLGGLHQAMLAHLPKIGRPRYVRYATAVPQASAPQKWTYHSELFGFPLTGALSRMHRLTNLFGPVSRVTCQLQYERDRPTDAKGYFRQCCCVAQLEFQRGVIAEVLYAKGEQTWRSQRQMEIEGDQGALIFDGDQGTFLSADEEMPIEVGTRRGLFAKDTCYVLDALTEGKPLYVTPAESLYALQVAAAAEMSAHTGKTIAVEATYPSPRLQQFIASGR